ncbi:hypothetical protein L4D76_24495 [Photobacterium sagamiensis]|uniref:hypothetical protein n=1 Tax=Photobacterium sagamiensis TaxID=2910241 RepID=UPI003D124A2A
MNNEKKTALEMLEDVRTSRNCHDVVLQIMQLAMMNKDVIEINVRYQCNVDYVDVRVYLAGTEYGREQSPIYKSNVYLDRNSFEDDTPPLTQLLRIEDKLLELIAEAKDKAEVAA